MIYFSISALLYLFIAAVCLTGYGLPAIFLFLSYFPYSEITLRERLPFLPLDTERLARESGQDVQIKYYSGIWDDPYRKRDMLLEFNLILKDQIRDGDSTQNIEVTRNAIALLKRIDQQPSFEQVFKETVDG